jgi:hypothetical protein
MNRLFLYEQLSEVLRQPSIRVEFLQIFLDAQRKSELRATPELVRHARERCPPSLVTMFTDEAIVDLIQCDLDLELDRIRHGDPGANPGADFIPPPEELAACFYKILAQDPGLWNACFRLIEIDRPEYRLWDFPADLARRIRDLCPSPLQVALAEWAIDREIHYAMIQEAMDWTYARQKASGVGAINGSPRGYPRGPHVSATRRRAELPVRDCWPVAPE